MEKKNVILDVEIFKAKYGIPYCCGVVTLRCKDLVKGGFPLYLDIYKDGKRKRISLKERLVFPERTQQDRKSNKEVVKIAKVQAQDLNVSIAKDGAGFKSMKKVMLRDALQEYEDNRKVDGKETERSRAINDTMRHLERYAGGESKFESIVIGNVDKEFCLGFINYLKSARGLTKDVPLCKNTQGRYLSTFSSAMNFALREGYIDKNPLHAIHPDEKIADRQESSREFLTIDEMMILKAAPCKNPAVKAIFMFSCFCGLRLSDILGLQWKHIERDGAATYVHKIIQKTKREMRLFLGSEALAWVPTRESNDPEEYVFKNTPHKSWVSSIVEDWVKSAGIAKHISFHCARHTFATMSLTSGVDLYTTSKLLGHAKIETTQVYAKIIDKKKVEAVNMIDSLFNKKDESINNPK